MCRLAAGAGHMQFESSLGQLQPYITACLEDLGTAIQQRAISDINNWLVCPDPSPSTSPSTPRPFVLTAFYAIYIFTYVHMARQFVAQGLSECSHGRLMEVVLHKPCHGRCMMTVQDCSRNSAVHPQTSEYTGTLPATYMGALPVQSHSE